MRGKGDGEGEGKGGEGREREGRGWRGEREKDLVQLCETTANYGIGG